ncbi:MAG TPA: hypothetical protein PLZ29_09880, partial [Spirochaetota bacterium]|nr:hypothetical protein [Spirochaetota bacterium]
MGSLKGKFKSLKVILSTIVGLIVATAIIILIIISYNAAYSELEKSYVNQIQNVNGGINMLVEQYFAQNIQVAELYASSPVV